MILKVYPENPNPKAIQKIVKVLQDGGVVVYPTDTVYAFGCSIKMIKAIDRLKEIKGKGLAMMSIVCPDLSHIADYAKVSTPIFKILKKNLPGAFTFILKSSSRTPDKVLQGRKTIGYRIPNNTIALAIVKELGCPMVTASVRVSGLEEEYFTDPSLIEEKYHHDIDLVIDGGIGDNFASTVVDCSQEDFTEPNIIRQGRAELIY